MNVNLTKRPVSRQSHGEKNSNSSRLDHRGEYVKVVNTLSLSKTTGHQASFVTIDRAIRVIFDLEESLAVNNVGKRRRWNKRPSVVFL